MIEKNIDVEKAFCATPKLLDYMNNNSKIIRNYDKIVDLGISEKEMIEYRIRFSKEDYIRKRTVLCAVFSDLNLYDLEIAYYLRVMRGYTSFNLSHMLGTVYEKQLNFDNKFRDEKIENLIRNSRLGI